MKKPIRDIQMRVGSKTKAKYKIFPWKLTAIESEKTLNEAEDFINSIGAQNVMTVMNLMFGIVVWYRV